MSRFVLKNPGDSVPQPITRRHLTLVPRALSPEEVLERGMRELAARAKRSGNSTAYASRAVADIAQGVRFPLRIVARIIASVLRGGGPVEFGEELGYLIIDFNVRKAHALGRPMPPRDDDGTRRAA